MKQVRNDFALFRDNVLVFVKPQSAQNDYTCTIFTYCITILIIRAHGKDLLATCVQCTARVCNWFLLTGFLYDEMTGGPRYSVYVLGFDLLGVLYIPANCVLYYTKGIDLSSSIFHS